MDDPHPPDLVQSESYRVFSTLPTIFEQGKVSGFTFREEIVQDDKHCLGKIYHFENKILAR